MLKHLVCLVAAIILAPLFALLLVNKFGVNVPYWDQWEYIPFFEQYTRGSLLFSTLFTQHVEYRQFFPNLVFVFLGALSNWNTVWEMYLSWCLQLGCLALILTLVRHSGVKQTAYLAIVSCLVFHPFQLENWLSGVQIVYFLGNFAFLCAVVSAQLISNNLLKVSLVSLFSFIAALSSANGMLSFLLAGPIVIFNSDYKTRIRSGGILISAFLLTMVIYFYDYQRPPLHPAPSTVFHNLGQSLQYFLSFLGRPLEMVSFAFEGLEQSEWHQLASLNVSVVFGFFLVILYLENLLWWLRAAPKNERFSSLPWIVIGAYSICTAILTTIGRVGFGVQQSLAPRYVSFSLWLPLAIFILTCVRDHKGSSWVRSGLISLLLTSFIFGFGFAPTKGRQYRQSRYQVKACVEFAKVSDSNCIEEMVYPNKNLVVSRAEILSRIGYLNPAPLKSRIIGETDLNLSLNSLIPEGSGHIDSVHAFESGGLEISGSASLLSRQSSGGKRQSPELIVVTGSAERDDLKSAKILSTSIPESNYIWLKYPNISQREMRWRWKIKITEQVDSARYLQIWSYDVVDHRLNLIGQPIDIEELRTKKNQEFQSALRVG